MVQTVTTTTAITGPYPAGYPRRFSMASGAGAGSAPAGAVGRRLVGRLDAEHLGQLAGLVDLGHDVGAADQLALHEELRDRRPVRERGELLADPRVGQDVDRGERRVEDCSAATCGRRTRTWAARASPS